MGEGCGIWKRENGVDWKAYSKVLGKNGLDCHGSENPNPQYMVF
jgi:hypothetical protein